jgi:hypothetical protein
LAQAGYALAEAKIRYRARAATPGGPVRRRGFFTAIAAAVAAVEMAPHGLTFSPHACILCGFERDLSPWGWDERTVMRCADKAGCQARQINALLGTRTPWQERTGTVMAKGKRT